MQSRQFEFELFTFAFIISANADLSLLHGARAHLAIFQIANGVGHHENSSQPAGTSAAGREFSILFVALKRFACKPKLNGDGNVRRWSDGSQELELQDRPFAELI